MTMKNERASLDNTLAKYCRIAVPIVGLVLIGTGAPLAHAAGVVTTCDETHLLAALAGGGRINFVLASPCAITLSSTITIARDTTIDAAGQTVALSGGYNVGGPFSVLRVPGGVALNLNNLRILNGFGGGIDNAGKLRVTNATISNNGRFGINNFMGTVTAINSVFGGNGGPGINNVLGKLSVIKSTFIGNNAVAGAGIESNGMLTVVDSTFSGNIAQFRGGGIDNEGTATVTDSTFLLNRAPFGLGGAINNEGVGAILTVINSSFVGNSAGSNGGTVRNASMLTLTNSTLILSAYGIGNAGTLLLNNTIVANTTTLPSCFGTVTDGGGNLATDASCGVMSVTWQSLSLGLFANQGGATQTVALLPASVAIGAGVEVNCPLSDQRGFPRPLTSPCSSGAYEPGATFDTFWIDDANVSPASGSFSVSGAFTLGVGTNGIAPPSEIVQFRCGSFSTVLQPGSFTGRNGHFSYISSDGAFRMTIESEGANRYEFSAAAQLASLAGTTQPVTVQLRIGDEGGTASAEN